VVTGSQLSGYYPFNTRPWTRPDSDATTAGLFDRPVVWRKGPSYRLESANLRMLDLNGDAMTDVLLDAGRAWMAWTRDQHGGWAEMPRVLRSDDTPPVRRSDPGVFVADLTGDGGQDIVRLEGDVLRYWPSLGPGRWGGTRSMRIPGAPDRLDPRRVL